MVGWRGVRKMFKGGVQKNRHRASGVGKPEGPRALATLAGVKGQKTPGEVPEINGVGRWVSLGSLA